MRRFFVLPFTLLVFALTGCVGAPDDDNQRGDSEDIGATSQALRCASDGSICFVGLGPGLNECVYMECSFDGTRNTCKKVTRVELECTSSF